MARYADMHLGRAGGLSMMSHIRPLSPSRRLCLWVGPRSSVQKIKIFRKSFSLDHMSCMCVCYVRLGGGGKYLGLQLTPGDKKPNWILVLPTWICQHETLCYLSTVSFFLIFSPLICVNAYLLIHTTFYFIHFDTFLSHLAVVKSMIKSAHN